MDIDPRDIAAGLILISLVLAGIYYLWGLNSGTEVSIGDYTTHDCSGRLASLSQEYGNATTQDEFFLDGNDIYLIDFNSSWAVPFSGQDCRIIEESNLSETAFQTSYFKENLAQVDSGFFNSTRDCINIAAAKGASNACDLTGM